MKTRSLRAVGASSQGDHRGNDRLLKSKSMRRGSFCAGLRLRIDFTRRDFQHGVAVGTLDDLAAHLVGHDQHFATAEVGTNQVCWHLKTLSTKNACGIRRR